MTPITCAADLRAFPHWVNFAFTPQPPGAKPKKTPYTPGTTTKARPNDPRTWRTHAEAVADGRVAGVAITPEMNLTLVDVDGRIDRELIATLDSYAEESINGGLHILASGRPPAGFVAPHGIEVYPRAGNRFLILTEAIIDGRDTIEDRTELLAQLFPPAAATQPITPLAELDTDDQTIIARVLLMPKGRQLHGAGDTTGYPSASEADLALLNCYVKAGMTSPDRFAALYAAAALDNPHWQKADYRKRTISRALDGYVQPFESYAPTATIARSVDQPAPLAADSQSLRFAPGSCADRLGQLEAENAALRAALAERDQLIASQAARIDTLKTVQLATNRIIGNRSHGPSRVVAAVVATEIAWRATAGATPPKEKDWQVPAGTMAISLGRIANRAGVSVNTASSHLQTLEDRKLIRKETKTVLVRAGDVKDPDSGELYTEDGYITQLFIGPAKITPINAQAAIDLSNDLASFSIQRTENRGGKRTPRCPDHPDAPVTRYITDQCSIPSCKRVLNTDEYPLPAMLLGPPEDAPAAPATESQSLGVTNPAVVDRHYRPQSLGFGQDTEPDSERRFVVTPSRPPLIGTRTPPGRCLDCGETIPLGTFYCSKHGGIVPPMDRRADVAVGAD